VDAATESGVITQVVRDYYEAWFDGDLARMDRVLHPELAKRSTGAGTTTKERMLELTAAGEGADDAGDRQIEIDIEDADRDIASVTVRTAVYYEYLHLVRTGDGWRIANALWQLR
jgi:ketosteroid isomerase-like protein